MKQFYVYKCVNDDGGAPCVERGLLSLCICKPAIRSTARVGDVIVAFGSNSESPANRLVYMAVVTRRLSDGQYYERREYGNRSDCIYERTRTGRLVVRSDARFHGSAEAMLRDLGPWPKYRRAHCLVSSDFRYFGGNGTDEWKARSPALARMVESLKQGHRKKHPPTIRAELLKLKQWIWHRYPRKVLGRPLHSPDNECTFDDDAIARKVCKSRGHRKKLVC